MNWFLFGTQQSDLLHTDIGHMLCFHLRITINPLDNHFNVSLLSLSYYNYNSFKRVGGDMVIGIKRNIKRMPYIILDKKHLIIYHNSMVWHLEAKEHSQVCNIAGKVTGNAQEQLYLTVHRKSKHITADTSQSLHSDSAPICWCRVPETFQKLCTPYLISYANHAWTQHDHIRKHHADTIPLAPLNFVYSLFLHVLIVCCVMHSACIIALPWRSYLIYCNQGRYYSAFHTSRRLL